MVHKNKDLDTGQIYIQVCVPHLLEMSSHLIVLPFLHLLCKAVKIKQSKTCAIVIICLAYNKL